MPDLLTLDWLTAGLFGAGGALESAVLAGTLLFFVTFALVLFGIPGIILPLSIGSGAILGGPMGAAVVGFGALAGSQLLFMLSRRIVADRVHARWGSRLAAFEGNFRAYGMWYVIGLRLIGTPNALVTASSAALRMRPALFAAATFFGLLPTVVLAAVGGSAL